jgi:DNA-binding GntR family transcriptional regulator
MVLVRERGKAMAAAAAATPTSMTAILGGDAEAARAAMEEHCDATAALLRGLLG